MFKNKKAQSGAAIAAVLIAIIFTLVAVQIAQETYDSSTDTTAASQELSYTSGGSLQTFTLSPVEQGVVTSTVVIGNSTANFTTPDDYNVTEAGVVYPPFLKHLRETVERAAVEIAQAPATQ